MFPTFRVQNYAFIATLQKYDKGIIWNLKDLFFYNIKNSVLIITHVKTDRIKGALRFHSELLPNDYHTYGAHRGIISNSSSALQKFLNLAHRKAHSQCYYRLTELLQFINPYSISATQDRQSGCNNGCCQSIPFHLLRRLQLLRQGVKIKKTDNPCLKANLEARVSVISIINQ